MAPRNNNYRCPVVVNSVSVKAAALVFSLVHSLARGAPKLTRKLRAVTGQIKPCEPGRLGSGRVRVTRPDP